MEIDAAEVTFPGHGGEPIGAFLARPVGAGPFPALVVVHEVHGPSDHVRGMARRFADEGFVAIAPDLWHRDRGKGFPEGSTDLAVLKAFVETVPDARMTGDLAAAARFLRTRPEVRRESVGTVGFCMGGIYAFHLACEPGAVRACVDFYGRLRYDRPSPAKPRGNLDRVAELRCPFLGIFGGMDNLIPLQDVLALKECLGARGFVIAYPRAGHAFMNETRPSYRKEEAEDAWGRTLLFLREHLAPETLPPGAGPAVPTYVPPQDDRRKRGPGNRHGPGRGPDRGPQRGPGHGPPRGPNRGNRGRPS
jgi:carboxymethylenebutenolidase